MALQLSGAAKMSSIANLQLRLPVVVIGGGLTAVDTATESLAYYVRQVEKFALRHRTLIGRARRGGACRRGWSEEEREIAANVPRPCRGDPSAERAVASAGGQGAGVWPQLLEAFWRGHRRLSSASLTEAPSYTLNHEEVAKAHGGGGAFRRGAFADSRC